MDALPGDPNEKHVIKEILKYLYKTNYGTISIEEIHESIGVEQERLQKILNLITGEYIINVGNLYYLSEKGKHKVIEIMTPEDML